MSTLQTLNAEPVSHSLDAFALNFGDPYADFVADSLSYLFAAAEANDFKLFISMDLYAQGDTCYKSNTACNGVSSSAPDR